MTLFSVLTRFLMAAPLALLLGGCSPLGDSPADEQRDPHYLAGKNRQSAMDYDGAIAAFEAALASNPRSASAHLELGFLYAEKKNNYATAIHHFERHLELRPESNLAETVKQHIYSCKLQLAKTVSFALASRQVQDEIRKLSATNSMLHEHVQLLKLQLVEQAAAFSNKLALLAEVSLQARPPSQLPAQPERRPIIPSERTLATVSYPPAQLRPDPLPRTHLVRPGETLASIARQYKVRLDSLQAVNPRIEPRRLRPGQLVNLPSSRN